MLYDGWATGRRVYEVGPWDMRLNTITNSYTACSKGKLEEKVYVNYYVIFLPCLSVPLNPAP